VQLIRLCYHPLIIRDTSSARPRTPGFSLSGLAPARELTVKDRVKAETFVL